MDPETRSAGPAWRELGYDETLVVLRQALIACAANSRAFGARATAGHGLISARGWTELAEIETRLAQLLDTSLERELRADAFPVGSRLRAWLRSVRDRGGAERAVIARQRAETLALPLAVWRSGAPQLEATLWPFFRNRTEHLANTLSLALNEPAPFAPIVWHPGRKEFRRQS